MANSKKLFIVFSIVTLIAVAVSAVVVWNIVKSLTGPDIDSVGKLADEATVKARDDGFPEFRFYTAGQDLYASTNFSANLRETDPARLAQAVDYANKAGDSLRDKTGLTWNGEVTGTIDVIEVTASTDSSIEAIRAVLQPVVTGQISGITSIKFEPYGMIIRGNECRADKVGPSGTWADDPCTLLAINSARTLVSHAPEEFIHRSSVWVKFGPPTNELFDGPRQWIAKADQNGAQPLSANEMANKLTDAATNLARERSIDAG